VGAEAAAVVPATKADASAAGSSARTRSSQPSGTQPSGSVGGSCMLSILRSFDVNAPGADARRLRGGVVGGSLLTGRLRVGQEVELLPGVLHRQQPNRNAGAGPATAATRHGTKAERPSCKGHDSYSVAPIRARIIGIKSGARTLSEAHPGGLIAVELDLDPALTRGDALVGMVMVDPQEERGVQGQGSAAIAGSGEDGGEDGPVDLDSSSSSSRLPVWRELTLRVELFDKKEVEGDGCTGRRTAGVSDSSSSSSDGETAEANLQQPQAGGGDSNGLDRRRQANRRLPKRMVQPVMDPKHILPGATRVRLHLGCARMEGLIVRIARKSTDTDTDRPSVKVKVLLDGPLCGDPSACVAVEILRNHDSQAEHVLRGATMPPAGSSDAKRASRTAQRHMSKTKPCQARDAKGSSRLGDSGGGAAGEWCLFGFARVHSGKECNVVVQSSVGPVAQPRGARRFSSNAPLREESDALSGLPTGSQEAQGDGAVCSDAGSQNRLTGPDSELYLHQRFTLAMHEQHADFLDDTGRRVKVPPLELVRQGGSRVLWTNFGAVCHAIRRPTSHVAAFLRIESGTWMGARGERVIRDVHVFSTQAGPSVTDARTLPAATCPRLPSVQASGT